MALIITFNEINSLEESLNCQRKKDLVRETM